LARAGGGAVPCPLIVSLLPHCGTPLFKLGHFDFVSGGVFDARATQTFVDEPAMLVAVKLIPQDAPAVKSMDLFSMHVKGIFVAAEAKVMVVKVIMTDKYEKVLSQPKIKPDLHHGAPVESPTTVHPDCAKRQGCPAKVTVRLSVTPAHPSRAPNQIGDPQPTVTGLSNPTAVMEGDISPTVIRYPKPTVFRVNPVPIVIIGAPVSSGSGGDDFGR